MAHTRLAPRRSTTQVMWIGSIIGGRCSRSIGQQWRRLTSAVVDGTRGRGAVGLLRRKIPLRDAAAKSWDPPGGCFCVRRGTNYWWSQLGSETWGYLLVQRAGLCIQTGLNPIMGIENFSAQFFFSLKPIKTASPCFHTIDHPLTVCCLLLSFASHCDRLNPHCGTRARRQAGTQARNK